VQRPQSLWVRNLPNCAVPIATTVQSRPVEVAQRVQTDSTLRPVAIHSVFVEVVQVGVEEAPRSQLEHRALAVCSAAIRSPVDVARRIYRLALRAKDLLILISLDFDS
jgi:hypothetical protein